MLDELHVEIREFSPIIKVLKKRPTYPLINQNKTMEFNFFIGVDVSKLTLDFVVRNADQVLFHLQTQNDKKGVKAFEKQCKIYGVDLCSSLICMEHTGIYNAISLDYFHQKSYAIWLENALQIKQSMGMVRGKSDKVDAGRIGEYAFRFRDKACLWQPEREVITQLRHLSSLRRRLIDAKNQLKVPLKETKGLFKKSWQQRLERLHHRPIATLEAHIKTLDHEIEQVIQSDHRLRELFEQVCSVDGVGKVLGCEMLITTNEFIAIREAKKYACYSGVAPFEHSSGSSLRGKNRVSRMGNKSTKRLLHMAAMAAIAMKGELQDFYQRKVGEGKNKMSVLNAVRNKLIHRVYACVKAQRKYEKNYTHPLA